MMLFHFPAQVNERAARLVAAAVAGSVLAGWLVGQTWVLPVLASGFVLRVAWGPRFSPLARLAVAVSHRLWEIRPVAGPPKRFAQGIGALFTLAATLLVVAGHSSVAWAVAGVVAVFATLEATLAICVGCWVYARLHAAGLFAPEACVDCAPLPQGSSFFPVGGSGPVAAGLGRSDECPSTTTPVGLSRSTPTAS